MIARNIKDHCHYTGKYRGAPHNICNLMNKIPKDVPIVFHNVSKYDYHLIAISLSSKALAEEFKAKFCCLGKSTEKSITLSVSIKKLNQKY